MISEKKAKYSFIIANTNSSDKSGSHWWSIMDIEPRADLFISYSFGMNGLKSFIMQDDKKVIEKILLGTEQLTRTDNKTTLKFCLNACKNQTKNELDHLSNTARNFLYFVQSFGDKLKLRDFVNLWVVEDRIQDLDSVTCSIFQIYFYGNLFNPYKNNKIQNKTKLNQKTIEILLNELFTLDNQPQNEDIINGYSYEHNITMT